MHGPCADSDAWGSLRRLVGRMSATPDTSLLRNLGFKTISIMVFGASFPNN